MFTESDKYYLIPLCVIHLNIVIFLSRRHIMFKFKVQ